VIQIRPFMAVKIKPPHWLALIGNPAIGPNEIRFTAAPTFIPNQGEGPLALLKSDKSFQSGHLSLEFSLENPSDRVQFVLNQGLEEEIHVGLNTGTSPYGIVSRRGPNWTMISAAGYGTVPPNVGWHSAAVTVAGSEIRLTVDEVDVVTGHAQVEMAQVAMFLQIMGNPDPAAAPQPERSVAVRNITIESRKPKAFVVMQFTDEFNALFKEVIQPMCIGFGYEVIRADDIYNNGLIISDIVQSIQDASVIIADITPNNVNVFYEVGYAHAARKPTILLCSKTRDKLPFDLAGFRTLFYDNTIAGKTAVESMLRQHLENLPRK
jgi:hypothetical protein